jgi:hypothetical protein
MISICWRRAKSKQFDSSYLSTNHTSGLRRCCLQKKMVDHIKNVWSSYLQWVSDHPQLATDVETSVKWISYIATGTSYQLV